MDPLDWTHQWDHYEMMMYAVSEGETGIFMQVSTRLLYDGAEAWEVLYDRKIADVELTGAPDEGTDDWEERTLRLFLQEHPEVVQAEKAYLHEFLNRQQAEN